MQKHLQSRNEKVTMILKQRKDCWILYMTDMWFRYVLPIFIDCKKFIGVIEQPFRVF